MFLAENYNGLAPAVAEQHHYVPSTAFGVMQEWVMSCESLALLVIPLVIS